LALAEELARRAPQVARLEKALIATLSNMKRYDPAITQAFQYIVRHGEDLTILDALKIAHFYTGRTEEAIRFGQRAIELRDAEAGRAPPPVTVSVPGTPPQGANVLSYSLWGALPFYGYGAMINLTLARRIYPDWTCRFYVDANVPRACVAYLRDNGGDVRNIEDEYPRVGLFQRSLVINDPRGRPLPGARLGRAAVGGGSRPGAAMDRQPPSVPRRARPSAAQRADDRLPVGRPHRLRHRYRRFDTALFQVRTDRQIRPRSAHAGADAMAADPQSLPGAYKHYRLDGVHTAALTDPKSHFDAGHQNLTAVLGEVEQLGIPRLL
jgi:hypothetical protein